MIDTQQDLDAVRKRRFCYICGREFLQGDRPNADHVPPKALFHVNHRREKPLVLPTHPACNEKQSGNDQVVAELVSIIHTKRRNRDRLRRYMFPKLDQKKMLLQSVDLREIIWRWVRGFHAALYEEFLPDVKNAVIYLPFPHGHIKGEDIKPAPIVRQQHDLVETLRENRYARTVDEIRCYGGKCHYMCCWTHADNRRPICVFGLRLYDWEDVADSSFPRRACVGVYWPPAERPSNATPGTSIEFPFDTGPPLDPFQD